MPLWRCPFCGTPQAESSRCWVCKRSSTCCATCRHFRRSVAAQLGYCGLDRRRLPLRGDEIRACWEAPIAAVETPAEPPPPLTVERRVTGFVPVALPGDPTPAPVATATTKRPPRDALALPVVPPPIEERRGLWGDAEG